MKNSTIHDLYASGFASVPNETGIYYVMAPKDMPICFLPEARNPHAPFYNVNTLREKYAQCVDKEILYIGKASGKKGLRQRLKQYIKYGWNEASNHKGGRAIWQIDGAENLLVAYECCKNADTREHELLREFRVKNGCYPLANWRG